MCCAVLRCTGDIAVVKVGVLRPGQSQLEVTLKRMPEELTCISPAFKE
jgi:hypothetical protein